MYEYLQPDDVLQIHDYSIQRYGGLPGLNPKEGMHCVEAKCYLMQQSFDGKDLYPLLEEKAAAYNYYFTIGHCFVDGNKRVGYLAASTFLNLNGYEFLLGDEGLYNMSISISNNEKRPSFHRVVDWVRKHVRKTA
ncbi:MAG TPA: type II toxin-antitoxin system death-on-curing family toxin [Pseudogracilibacillus sp.]|nr:type II toxin-antitoxin system death-on-curing family toxin [Pseudogracilibacillus sp.]